MKGYDLSNDLTHLTTLDRPALCEHWRRAFGCPAPKSCSHGLLCRILAWHLQMQAHQKWQGGAGRNRWKRILQDTASLPIIKPGTQLLREWQGQTHRVLVAEEGFEYDGTRFKSLSAIARHITGTAWSGPSFFGLNRGEGRGRA